MVVVLPSYNRDTSDFINQLTVTGTDRIPATTGVLFLCTNIPQNVGLMALKHFPDKRRDLSPPAQFILDMTDMVLSKAYFLFGRDFYLQNIGVAMGAALAPDFANQFLGMMEERYIYSI